MNIYYGALSISLACLGVKLLEVIYKLTLVLLLWKMSDEAVKRVTSAESLFILKESKIKIPTVLKVGGKGAGDVDGVP